MIGRYAGVADRIIMAEVIGDTCLRNHPGLKRLIEKPMTSSEAAILYIYWGDRDLMTVHVGHAGVTMRTGRSTVDMPYQCDTHPADVANQLLSTVTKGISR